ncbi:MAG: hypothetical protein QOJ38_1461 [Solirubrobacterales bacterium]|jgi:glycine/D-amino acid oxidase-like deaminating enzyme/nitrite reductase/ring-hydroxylating ferredoxin subunit|nr:hypothetical protein [Solirubrobacterales bacterium]
MPAPGRPGSLWIETAAELAFPALSGRASADVAVVGAGIAGLAAALALQADGADVAIVELSKVGEGVTGHTTGKVTALHGLAYDKVASKFGDDGARAYAEANSWGLARVEELAAGGIDCDLERLPTITYADRDEDVTAIEREVEAANRAGLAATYVESTDLPYPIKAGVRVEQGAAINAAKLCQGMAARFVAAGGRIYEGTRAVGVDEGSPCSVRCDGGELVAESVVLATNIPFLDRDLFFARTSPHRSYCIAFETANPVHGMYINASAPTRSLRPAPVAGAELIVLGGEGHKVGQADNHTGSYERLAQFATTHFPDAEFRWRWSSQDYIPADDVPYIGRLRDRVYVATGMKKWGLAHGLVAGRIFADLAAGRESPWAELYDPTRIKPRASALKLIEENLNVAKRFLLDRLRWRGGLDEVAPGSGRVIGRGRRQLAVYRDEAGAAIALSARCTHLGCIVAWNDAEHTWDCPCHGSRFDVEGRVVNGPATSDLERAEL